MDLAVPPHLTGEEKLRAGANLIEANLREANLAGAKLRGAKLLEANLQAAVLTGANLIGANLAEAILQKANLTGAKLFRATLVNAYASAADFTDADLTRAILNMASLSRGIFSGANLEGVGLVKAHLSEAKLRKANLTRAWLLQADLFRADLTGANLNEAYLTGAHLVDTDFTGADLTGCRVYGISAWNLKLDGAAQKNLIITPDDEPKITVDNLEVAQFIYLLLKNERIRHVIDTITSKVVLILGRFTSERKAVPDALRKELRQRNYTPVLFDFDKPARQDLLGTVETLARMARFVIADITEASSVLAELQAIVPHLRTVPVQPLLRTGAPEYALFASLRDPFEYGDVAQVRSSLDRIISPAEAKVSELRGLSPPRA